MKVIEKPERILKVGNVSIKDIVIYKKQRYRVLGFKEGKILCLVPFGSNMRIDKPTEVTISKVVKT